jgi:hypothetical protein
MVVCDGLKGLPAAIETVWPQAITQTCVIGLRTGLGLRAPVLGEIKNACHPEHVEQVRGWLEEARAAAACVH